MLTKYLYKGHGVGNQLLSVNHILTDYMLGTKYFSSNIRVFCVLTLWSKSDKRRAVLDVGVHGKISNFIEISTACTEEDHRQ